MPPSTTVNQEMISPLTIHQEVAIAAPIEIAWEAVLDQMGPEETKTFLDQYAAKMRDAYPPQPDGKTILPFRRMFIIARRRSLAKSLGKVV